MYYTSALQEGVGEDTNTGGNPQSPKGAFSYYVYYTSALREGVGEDTNTGGDPKTPKGAFS